MAETPEIQTEVENNQSLFGVIDPCLANFDERSTVMDDKASSDPSGLADATTIRDETNYSEHVGGVRGLLSMAQNLEQQALELRQVAQARIEGLLKDLSGSGDV